MVSLVFSYFFSCGQFLFSCFSGCSVSIGSTCLSLVVVVSFDVFVCLVCILSDLSILDHMACGAVEFYFLLPARWFRLYIHPDESVPTSVCHVLTVSHCSIGRCCYVQSVFWFMCVWHLSCFKTTMYKIKLKSKPKSTEKICRKYQGNPQCFRMHVKHSRKGIKTIGIFPWYVLFLSIAEKSIFKVLPVLPWEYTWVLLDSLPFFLSVNYWV